MAWREYVRCPDCGQAVKVDYTAGETRDSALAEHKASEQCRPCEVPEGPLSLAGLQLCLQSDLAVMASGLFDVGTVGGNLEGLLCHQLPEELQRLVRQGLSYIHYGAISEADVPRLADIIRQILVKLSSLHLGAE